MSLPRRNASRARLMRRFNLQRDASNQPQRGQRPWRRTVSALFSTSLILAFLAGLSGASLAGFSGPSVAAAAPAMSGLQVVGNQLVNANNQAVVLHGVNRSGLEYACIQGWGIFDGDDVMSDDLQVPLMKTWGINEVNLGLNEDCWLGINGVASAYGGTSYISAVQHEVATLESYGIYPVINLFWEAPGSTKATDQIAMPDNDHAPALWQSVANTFKNDPRVIFRLKEEPYPAGNTDGSAAWQCWKNGDVQYAASGSLSPISTTTNCTEGYRTVGMQSLINIIRGTGATNVIQVPGVEYANSMTHFLDPAYRVTDTLAPPQLMAVVDVYPVGNVCGSTTCYTNEYAPVIASMPFMAGEFGESVDGSACGTTNVDALMSWFDQHAAGYSAWTWDTWGDCLQLISSYSTGAPDGTWGTDYQRHVLGLVGSNPAPLSTPAVSPIRSLMLYDGQVAPGFDDGTFSYTLRNQCDQTVYYSGRCSYSIAYAAWGGLNFQVTKGLLSTAGYETLSYKLNPNHQPISFFGALFTDASDTVINQVVLTSSNTRTLSNGWLEVSIPIAQLNPNNVWVTSIQLKSESASRLATVHYAEVQLVTTAGGTELPGVSSIPMASMSSLTPTPAAADSASPTSLPIVTDTAFGDAHSVAPMRVISRGVPAYASPGYPAGWANDDNYSTVWRSSAGPSAGNPQWLAYDLSELPPSQRTNVVVAWYNDDTGDYYQQSVYYGLARDYTLEANSAPGGTTAPQSGWTTLLTISANTYTGRAHPLNLAGYNWLRLSVTATNGADDAADVSVQMDVHDTSQSAQDQWLFLGDSITVEAFNHHNINGSAWRGGNYQQLINAALPSNFPLVLDGGVGGTNMAWANANKDALLGAFGGQYVSVAFGTNDANVAGALSGEEVSEYYTDLLGVIDSVLARGMAPVVPHIPWGCANSGWLGTNAKTLNDYVDQHLWADRPQVVPGPDLWTYFQSNPSLLSDCIHPSSSASPGLLNGYEHYLSQWRDAMLTNVYREHHSSAGR